MLLAAINPVPIASAITDGVIQSPTSYTSATFPLRLAARARLGVSGRAGTIVSASRLHFFPSLSTMESPLSEFRDIP